MIAFDWWSRSQDVHPQNPEADTLIGQLEVVAKNHFELIVTACLIVCAASHILTLLQKSLWIVLLGIIAALAANQAFPGFAKGYL